MITRKVLLSASALYNILSFPFASCHMEMSWPYPLRSRYNPSNSYSIIDYSMTSPLNADGLNFPCKGYQNDRPIQTTISYTAGSTYNMTLAGSATHGGGSCQLSLSYDNGATFRVIKSMIGGCPLTSTYEFTIPSYAPAGVALFAWTWQNFEGNREFYMNCAEVNIVSGAYARRQKRQAYSTFDQLPYIWKANLEGVNMCITTEREDPVYPNPGPDVIHGDGLSSSSIPSSGACDSATPYGLAYRDLGDSNQPASSPPQQPDSPTAIISNVYPTFPYEPLDNSADTSSVSYPMFSYAPLTTTDSTSALPSSFLLSVDSIAQQRQATVSSQSYSTTTITIDCPATVTSTVYPSAPTSTITLTPSPTYYTTAASACTGTSASCPCARNYACQELSPCTWACNAYSTPTTLASSSSTPVSRSATWSTRSSGYTRSTTWTSRRSSRSTIVITTTHTVTPVKPTSSSRPSPTGHPPYATVDVERYLPCVPGTFICTSDMAWDTCNYPDCSDPDTPSNSWVYGYSRNVSAGMECITFLSPYSSETDQHAQQALTPQGYFRDDRIVRARPDGDCDDDGSIKCTDGGSQFEVCDQGGWVLVGTVANGTICSNGEIVASG